MNEKQVKSPQIVSRRNHCRDNVGEARMAGIDLTQSERVHTKASSKIRRKSTPRETEKPSLMMIDEKPTDGTRTCWKDQDGHGIMKSEFFFKKKKFSGLRTHVAATTLCTTGGGTYTHLLHVHFSEHGTFSCVCTYTHGSRSWKRFVACACRVSPLSHVCHMFHSPSLLFPDGHFETTFPTLTSTTFLPNFTCPESAGRAQRRTSTEEFGYLAKSGLNTGYEPTWSSTKSLLTIQTSIASLTSRKHERTLDCSVFLHCEIYVLQVSCGDFDLSNKRMPRETVKRQREGEKTEGSVISVAESMSRKRVDGTVLGVTLFRLTENSILMNEISQNTLNEELNKLFLVKIQFRENDIRLSTAWRPKIWSEEIQNTRCLSHSASLNFKDDNYWKSTNGQSNFNVREYICVANLRRRTIFIKKARSCREKEELKRRCYQEENTEKQRRLEECHTQHDQKSRTVSLLRDQVRRLQERELLESIEDSKTFCDPDSPSSCDCTYVPREALITSSSRKPSRVVEMLRNTREDVSIPGNVFDCQHARGDPDELHNDSRNLAESLTMSTILRKERIEKSGSEEPLRSTLLTCFSVRARRKSLDDR